MDIVPGLAKKYNVKLVDVSRQTDYHKMMDMPEDTYIGHSFNTGNEIILGIYPSPELRLVSFFHELGHILYEGDVKNAYDRECKAWQCGFKLAKDEGVVFTDATMKWCREQLKGYKDA